MSTNIESRIENFIETQSAVVTFAIRNSAMIDDKTLLSEYLSESEELLDVLLADLDTLASSTTATPDTNLINRVFRTVHSLKGLSGMMGLAEVQALAHDFEDILDDLRLGQLSLSERTNALLQEAGAGLAALVGGAARGAATDEDFDRLRQLLGAIALKSRERSKKEESALDSLNLSDRERALLSDYEEYRVNENVRAGRSFYSIAVAFEVGKLDTGYRALAAKLEQGGELIATLPYKTTDPSAVGFKLIFAAALKEADVRRIAEPFGGRVGRLERSTWRRAGAALRAAGRRMPGRGSNAKASDDTPADVLPPSFAQEALQPLSPSVRVEMSQIDELSGLAHELSIGMERLTSMAEEFLDASNLGAHERFDLRFSARRMKREFVELEERLVELRMVSLAQTFTRAARLTGRLARELGKSVSVDVAGRETQLDKMIVDRVADSIYHVLRNAVDHGLEPPEERKRAGKPARGKVKLEARLEGTRAVIAISDDGHGIDRAEVQRQAIDAGLIAADEELSEEETLRLILRPGFSTADQVSAVSGRGVGLDAVERTVHELGGEVRISSEKGKWTRFELAVPTTLVMISAFIVRASNWRYAINVAQIIELLYVSPDEILGRDGRRSIAWRGATIPLVELKYVLGLGGARPLHQSPAGPNGDGAQPASINVPVLVTSAADRQVAVAVEHFDEQREIVVKSLGAFGRRLKGVVGAVDLEGGDVALVLDMPSLLVLRSMRL
ncbi:MAG TPA: chemotaxis protein CheW [Blastocatellia bacterium]|nr:chemotaxis protein CheW [Blastocatellia bacterium]